MDDVYLAVVGTVMVAVGALMGLFVCRRLIHAMRSSSWLSVEGELISAGLVQTHYRGIRAGGGSDVETLNFTDFSYCYRVDQQTYGGKRVTFSDHVNKSRRSLKRLQAKYQGQKRVAVYYDPADPSQSVLIPGAGVYNFTSFITPGLLIIAGYFLMTHDFG